MSAYRVIEGDALDCLRELEAESVQTCVTSPPYWGLRDYGTATWAGGNPACAHRIGGQVQDSKAAGAIVAGVRPGVDASRCLDCGATRTDSQLGLEPTPEEYVANLVAVFRGVRRVLRDDGTLWLNLGDSYAAGAKGGGGIGAGTLNCGPEHNANSTARQFTSSRTFDLGASGLKPKDLVGIPWMVAFALRADGWYLRSDIIWSKPNPMPESVTDRPTKAHEYLFLLSKSGRSYFYDAEAIREDDSGQPSGNGFDGRQGGARTTAVEGGDGTPARFEPGAGRNRRSVWTVATQPFPGAHFATFPPKLIEPCILAGSPPKCCGECGAPWERLTKRERTRDGEPLTGAWAGPDDPRRLNATGVGHWRDETQVATLGWQPTCDHDDDTGRATVLDPFAGAGTTGLVALRHDRDFVGIELSQDYAQMARDRIRDDGPLLNVEAA